MFKVFSYRFDTIVAFILRARTVIYQNQGGRTQDSQAIRLQASRPQGGESSGRAGMCLARLRDRHPASLRPSGLIAGSRVGKEMHYREPWYGLGFDEVGDQRLNHVTLSAFVGKVFLFPSAVTVRPVF